MDPVTAIVWSLPLLALSIVYFGVGHEWRENHLNVAKSYMHDAKHCAELGELDQAEEYRQRAIKYVALAKMWPWWPVIQWNESRAARQKERDELDAFLNGN